MKANEASVLRGQIEAVVKNRQDVYDLQRLVNLISDNIAAETATTIKAGDQIRITAGLRPAYIIGATALVTKVNEKTVTVDFPLDPAYKRFAGAKRVRVPLTCVEAI